MQPTWPDERYAEAAWPVALACLQLLSEESRWIHRRVETVDLLAQELVRRQVTVEFTLPEPLLDELRVGPDGPWCVPIAILQKQPLRHFDLLEDDEWRPILGREHNGPIALALVLAAARLAIDSETIDSEVVLQLDRIAQGDPDDAREALAVLRRRARHEPHVATILGHETSGYFVETFAESYMLIALLAKPYGRRILKYSYDEHLGFIRGRPGRARRLAGRLGWSALVIDIAVPTASHTASYHAEVVVPEELRIDAFVLDASTDELLSTDIERGVDRASLHAPGVPLDADPLLTVAVSAERSGVPTLAFVISAVTALLLLLGAAVGRLDSPTAGSSVAVLLAGSVLFAATVARGGEHRLVRGIFAGQRWLLSMTAIAALAAAASVAFGASPPVRDTIWYAAGGASALACLGIAVAFAQAEPLKRRQSGPGTDDRT
jgi:hypothetical protein